MVPLLACSGGQEAQPESGPIAVSVMAVRATTLRDVVTAQGTVVPSPGADMLVTAPEAAEIAELTKNEGDAVVVGEVLVRLEIPSVANEVATRQLEVSEATARVEQARAEAARLGKLFEQGLAARNAWEAARSALAAAESNLSQVKGRFDAAKAMEANAVVRARFPGVVARRWHIKGDVVAGGEADPIMRVIDPTRMQIVAQVPVAQSARIAPGQLADVQTGAGAEPATVGTKNPPAALSAATVDVRLNFVRPTLLPIDSIVQVDFLVEERKDALVVPSDAIQRADGGTFVWIADGNSQAQKRPVTVGLVAGALTQVLSGLSAGEEIIVAGIAQLAEGVPVTIGR
jgi:RND family efflux transporter MFP subunit